MTKIDAILFLIVIFFAVLYWWRIEELERTNSELNLRIAETDKKLRAHFYMHEEREKQEAGNNFGKRA
jgi:membrane protein implicated in regulation of membrane protease activity